MIAVRRLALANEASPPTAEGAVVARGFETPQIESAWTPEVGWAVGVPGAMMGGSAETRALFAAVALMVTLAMGAASLAWLVLLPPDALRPGASAGPGVARSLPRRIARTIVGIALVALGAVLALPGVPGPGLLLVVLGIVVADLPGKRRAELHLLRRPRILGAINALRRHFRRDPLQPPA